MHTPRDRHLDELSLELIVAVDPMALLDALVVVLAATRAALLTSNALQPPARPHVSSRAFVVAEASAPPSRREARASEAAAKLKAPAAKPPEGGVVWSPPDVPETVAKLLKPSRIRKGDYVVHRKFGVGRFEGLFALKTVRIMKDGSEIPMKVLKVHFRDGDLEVPVEMKADLKLFKRRDEDGDSLDTVRLDSMRSSRTWERRKERAAKKVLTVAADLLNIYAQRQHLRRPPCAPDGDRFAKFADAFEFSPTADQLRCFDEVRDDMVASDRPMDRLVCGDVGFGKTEVALRAVYRAVCSGKQARAQFGAQFFGAQFGAIRRNSLTPTLHRSSGRLPRADDGARGAAPPRAAEAHGVRRPRRALVVAREAHARRDGGPP